MNKTFVVMVLLTGLVVLPLATWAESGADTFKTKNCSMCHGPEAKGKLAGTHDWRSEEVQKKSDADLTKTITDGKGKMPAYKEKLSADEIKGLVTYVRSFKK